MSKQRFFDDRSTGTLILDKHGLNLFLIMGFASLTLHNVEHDSWMCIHGCKGTLVFPDDLLFEAECNDPA